MSEAERARKLRRRHMHERQAVIFGVLLAFLALAFVTSAAVYTGNLKMPFFSRAFTSKPTPSATHDPQPCPPSGSLPVAAASITVNVYNGTTTPGLAKSTGDALSSLGFAIKTETNAIASYAGTARISFGIKGIAQAYTLAAYVDHAAFQLDTRQDASVDITVGGQFLSLKSSSTVKLDPNTPFAAPAGCVPYDQILATTATPPATAPAG
jgi:hypothetical protein